MPGVHVVEVVRRRRFRRSGRCGSPNAYVWLACDTVVFAEGVGFDPTYRGRRHPTLL